MPDGVFGFEELFHALALDVDAGKQAIDGNAERKRGNGGADGRPAKMPKCIARAL